MQFKELNIKDVYIIEPKVFGDERGYFFERYRKELFDSNIGETNFIQDNQSKSHKGVLRGLHYQKGKFSQGKLIWVISGTVVDVAVDLRKSSPTFGKYVMEELSDSNGKMMYIPRGFAHGFLVLSEYATFAYKVDNVYSPQHEVSIKFNDPTIGIEWPMDLNDIVVSDKDRDGLSLLEAEYFK